MKYSNLVKEYIKQSRLTLDELSEKIEESGLTASKQYLSKLQNGKTPPASDKMNRVIAEITGGEPEKLIALSYTEKAPQELIKMGFDKIVDYLIFEGEEPYDSPQQIGRGTRRESGTELVSAYLDLIKENENVYLIGDILKVPLLGYISAGKPIFAEEHIDEMIEVANPWGYKQNEIFMLKVKGDSMTGSRIFDGDKVLVKVQPDVENGDIAVVNVNGYEATLKKVKKLENGQVWLFPSNDNYDPILLDDENARIVGKVIQVMFEPK